MQNDSHVDELGPQLFELFFKELFFRIADAIPEEKTAAFESAIDSNDMSVIKAFIQTNVGDADAFIKKSFDTTLESLKIPKEETALSTYANKIESALSKYTEQAKKIIDTDMHTLFRTTHFSNQSQSTTEWEVLQSKNAIAALEQAKEVMGDNPEGKVTLWLESVSKITKEFPQKDETIAEYSLRAISLYLAHQK